MIESVTNFTELFSPAIALDLLAKLELQDYQQYDKSLIKSCFNDIQPLNRLDEKGATDDLIALFNCLFLSQNVILVRGDDEPEYFAATKLQPARIVFAHGFFASALHELSHWCIAGQKRRKLNDFGYWYAPDGRSEAQQAAFEQVEIKPQALECLFTLSCLRHFQVSQDNLFADFDTSSSTFAADVYKQVQSYLIAPELIPKDAQTLLRAFLTIHYAT